MAQTNRQAYLLHKSPPNTLRFGSTERRSLNKDIANGRHSTSHDQSPDQTCPVKTNQISCGVRITENERRRVCGDGDPITEIGGSFYGVITPHRPCDRELELTVRECQTRQSRHTGHHVYDTINREIRVGAVGSIEDIPRASGICGAIFPYCSG